MAAPNDISIKNKAREFIIVLVTVCASVALLYSILFSAGIGDVAYTETGTDARASIYDADGNLLQSNVDPEGWVSNHEKNWLFLCRFRSRLLMTVSLLRSLIIPPVLVLMMRRKVEARDIPSRQTVDETWLVPLNFSVSCV